MREVFVGVFFWIFLGCKLVVGGVVNEFFLDKDVVILDKAFDILGFYFLGYKMKVRGWVEGQKDCFCRWVFYLDGEAGRRKREFEKFCFSFVQVFRVIYLLEIIFFVFVEFIVGCCGEWFYRFLGMFKFQCFCGFTGSVVWVVGEFSFFFIRVVIRVFVVSDLGLRAFRGVFLVDLRFWFWESIFVQVRFLVFVSFVVRFL